MNRKVKWVLAAACATLAGAMLICPTWADGNAPAPTTPPAAAVYTGPGSRPAEAQSRPALAGEEAEVAEFAQRHWPEMYQRLEGLRKSNPGQARELVHRLSPLYHRVKSFPPEVRDAAVARYRANIAIYNLQRDVRMTSNPAAREKMIESIRTLLAEQFNNDQIVKEYEVKHLSKQLEDLRTDLEQRHANRDKILADRLKEVLSEGTPTKPASRPAGG